MLRCSASLVRCWMLLLCRRRFGASSPSLLGLHCNESERGTTRIIVTPAPCRRSLGHERHSCGSAECASTAEWRERRGRGTMSCDRTLMLDFIDRTEDAKERAECRGDARAYGRLRA